MEDICAEEEEEDIRSSFHWNDPDNGYSASSSGGESPIDSLFYSNPSTPGSARSESPKPAPKQTTAADLLHVPCDGGAEHSRCADVARRTYHGNGLGNIDDDPEAVGPTKHDRRLSWEIDLEACAASNDRLYSFETRLQPPSSPQAPMMLCTSPTGMMSLLYGKPDDESDIHKRMLFDRFRRRPERLVYMIEATWLGVRQKSLMPWRHIAIDACGRLIDCVVVPGCSGAGSQCKSLEWTRELRVHIRSPQNGNIP